MELDVVEYRRGDDEGIELASYIGDGKVSERRGRESADNPAALLNRPAQGVDKGSRLTTREAAYHRV